MTDLQWKDLLDLANGKKPGKTVPGFIIDSPWLPNWHGVTILDYFTSDEVWLRANLNAIETFPDVIFLPGFWSEYGMCTEPSAFGAKCIFWRDKFPFAEKMIHTIEDIRKLKIPDPETDGFLPFMLNRLLKSQKSIEEAGHKIKFSVSRGPLNIASFLMGTTELMTLLMLEREAIHDLIRMITDFLHSWHRLQRETFPTIEGIMILDDMVGFIGEEEFMEFGFPCFKELYDGNMKVRLFHNDADCRASISHYPDMGVNLYNPGIHMSLEEMVEVTGNGMTILGNIPPRDVLAAGSPEEVYESTVKMITDSKHPERLMPSCAGGMPPGVSTENIRAFIDGIKKS